MEQKDGTAGQQCVARREAEGMAERDRVECVDIATAVPQLADNFIHRTSRQSRADIVAKVENRQAIIFPPKDDMTDDRRSLYSQSRYQGRQ
jgi:hypothetical protein